MKKKMPKIGKELETQKVNTVNIIEYVDGSVHGVASFKPNKIGSREAAMLFYKLVKENSPETLDEEIEDCLDNGRFDAGSYEVYLAYSFVSK